MPAEHLQTSLNLAELLRGIVGGAGMCHLLGIASDSRKVGAWLTCSWRAPDLPDMAWTISTRRSNAVLPLSSYR